MNELRAENLHLWRGEQHVLRGLSFAVGRGQCLQVMGANGSGKTTLLRALCGLVPLEDGQVLWRGRPVKASRFGYFSQLTYLGHDNGLKADLSVPENLRLAARLHRSVGETEVLGALEQVGVADAAGKLLRFLSAGQRRRVALARVLLCATALWVLDEPGANLDPAGQALVTKLLAAHLADGGLAVVATHQALALPATRLLPLELQ